MTKTRHGKRMYRGDASVRTSFKLSIETLEALEALAAQSRSMKEVLVDACSDKILDRLVTTGPEEMTGSKSDRERRSFAISADALRLVTSEARKRKIDRDVLVERMILEYKSYREEKRKEERKNVTLALQEIDKLQIFLKDQEDRLEEIMTYDDEYSYIAIFDIHEMISGFVSSFHASIGAYLDKGVPIDMPISIPQAFQLYGEWVMEARKEAEEK